MTVVVDLPDERGTDAFNEVMVFVSDANDLVIYHRAETGEYHEQVYAADEWKAYSQGLTAPRVENRARA